jgi:hypothetical protein
MPQDGAPAPKSLAVAAAKRGEAVPPSYLSCRAGDRLPAPRGALGCAAREALDRRRPRFAADGAMMPAIAKRKWHGQYVFLELFSIRGRDAKISARDRVGLLWSWRK